MRAKAFNSTFEIRLPRGLAGRRRAALRWLADRLPAETISIHYEPVHSRVRVEMLVRGGQDGQTVDDLQRYALGVQKLLDGHLATVDEAESHALVEATRGELVADLAALGRLA